jgi:hypothetical protein
MWWLGGRRGKDDRKQTTLAPFPSAKQSSAWLKKQTIKEDLLTEIETLMKQNGGIVSMGFFIQSFSMFEYICPQLS